LGGDAKFLIPTGAQFSVGLFQHREVSFIGRPFPIGEADEHFSRCVRGASIAFGC